MAHYIGVDVGTGSARACIIDEKGDIKGLATKNIKLWQPSTFHYEQSTTDIWAAICYCVKQIVAESGVDVATIRGLGFDATCSLAVFTHDTDEPVSVTATDFFNTSAEDRNVILWLDHRPLDETVDINKTNDNLLRYVGGKMSPEMEIPKVLWLKKNMPDGLFDRCKFYDLVDALTHMATGKETRSFCSTVCKQGFVPVGVDGSVKGWQEDFYHKIGLSGLVDDNFKRMGGVNGVNGEYLSAGQLVGGLSAKAAEELGLRPGIAIGSGVIDAYAGWIGTVGAKLPDDPKETIGVEQVFTRLAAVAGTSTCHLVMSENPIFVDGIWGPYRDVLIPNYWMAEGGQSATGELMRHMINTHPACAEATTEAKAQKKNIYRFLNDHLQSMVQRKNVRTVSHLAPHIFFYGDLWGNRSPIADPNMKGALIGMSSDTSVDGLALLYYATMEFIALQTRHIIDKMNANGHSIRNVFMSGSQCQNEILMDLIATVCNKTVVLPGNEKPEKETSDKEAAVVVESQVVRGAAMLGAKAGSAEMGKEEDLWSIMVRMTKPGKLVQSSEDVEQKALLEVKYKVFEEQCETQQKYRKLVDEVLESKPKPEEKEEAPKGESNEKRKADEMLKVEKAEEK